MDVAITNSAITSVTQVNTEENCEELSVTLQNLADNATENVSVKQICEALGDRSFGAFLLVFCLPNLVPLPPGSSAILGIPLIIISFQILAGHSQIWLPKRLAEYSLSKDSFQSMIGKIIPHFKKGESFVKERYWPINLALGDKLFGLFSLILAVVVTIPIPLGNWPPAFAIAFLAAAYTKRDGIMLFIGTLLGIGSLILAGSVIFASIVILKHVF
ncbi:MULTISPECIES: exopolysaccharide biosynthesis protein [unclassified Lentilitoribacter]|uniref:exopolysaccharide biosynthesis protein n=1 Tax=unclassified Lentilitoribacter TaxID=2647570 RepID=UPI0013A6ED60|nr:exopolysaccharide biosynthesis protein [Lentilitoribacter sp. Alg239-R112]